MEYNIITYKEQYKNVKNKCIGCCFEQYDVFGNKKCIINNDSDNKFFINIYMDCVNDNCNYIFKCEDYIVDIIKCINEHLHMFLVNNGGLSGIEKWNINKDKYKAMSDDEILIKCKRSKLSRLIFSPFEKYNKKDVEKMKKLRYNYIEFDKIKFIMEDL